MYLGDYRKNFFLAVIGLFFLTKNQLMAVTPEVSKEREVVMVAAEQKTLDSNDKAIKDDSIVPAVSLGAVTLDEIKVVIFTQEGTEIITKSDQERPSLSGAQKTLDSLIFERLVFLDAKKYKAVPDDDAVDKYISRVLRENNMKAEDIEKMFENAGRSLKEGREELRMLQAVNSMIANKVHSSAFVSRQEVQAYYDQHPEYIDASAQVSRAVVPFVAGDRQAQEDALIQQIVAQQNTETLPWGSPFWVAESEIADDKKFIFTMNIGQISMPQVVAQGFELYQVLAKKEKRLRPLDERYQEIADILVRPKYEALLENYRKNLIESASIVYY